MFTGIVGEQGTVKRTRGRGMVRLEIEAPRTSKELRVGDSVSVNGVCLTATVTGRKRFEVEAMPETLARSTLDSLAKGSLVNLELPARLNDRLGGHLVQGHVDGIAKAVRIEDDDGARLMWFEADVDQLRYLVPKGSVTLDGVSLTLVDVGHTTFQVGIIPHTLEVTSLGRIEVGSYVNVEVDLIAKYVEHLTVRR
ncbi:MAG: riboflavin synthase [Actinomycetota bacterium]